MHTFLASGDGFDIRFCNSLGGGEVLYHTKDKLLAMEVVCFLNGGHKPINWNIDNNYSEPRRPGERMIEAARDLVDNIRANGIHDNWKALARELDDPS